MGANEIQRSDRLILYLMLGPSDVWSLVRAPNTFGSQLSRTAANVDGFVAKLARRFWRVFDRQRRRDCRAHGSGETPPSIFDQGARTLPSPPMLRSPALKFSAPEKPPQFSAKLLPTV